MRRENSLFSRGDLYASLESQKRQAVEAVNSLSSEQINVSTNEQLIMYFMDKFSISPIELYPDRIEKTMRECQFETRDSFTYDIRDGGSIKVPGIAVTVRMPFTGEVELLLLKPNSYSLTSVEADITKPNNEDIGWLRYEFTFNQHDATSDNIQQKINSAITFTVQTIENQKGQLVQFERECHHKVLMY